jgi:hypothetical protein
MYIRPFSALPSSEVHFRFKEANRPSTNHAATRPKAPRSSKSVGRQKIRAQSGSARIRQLHEPSTASKKGIFAALNPQQKEMKLSIRNCKQRKQSVSAHTKNRKSHNRLFSRPVTSDGTYASRSKGTEHTNNVRCTHTPRLMARDAASGRQEFSADFAHTFGYDISSSIHFNDQPQPGCKNCEKIINHADAKELQLLIYKMEKLVDKERMKPLPGSDEEIPLKDEAPDSTSMRDVLCPDPEMLKADDNMVIANSKLLRQNVRVAAPTKDAKRCAEWRSSPAVIFAAPETVETPKKINSTRMVQFARKRAFRASIRRPKTAVVRKFDHLSGFFRKLSKTREHIPVSGTASRERPKVPVKQNLCQAESLVYPPRVQNSVTSAFRIAKRAYTKINEAQPQPQNAKPTKTALQLSSEAWKIQSPRFATTVAHKRLQEDVARLEKAVAVSKHKIMHDLTLLLHPANHNSF